MGHLWEMHFFPGEGKVLVSNFHWSSCAFSSPRTICLSHLPRRWHQGTLSYTERNLWCLRFSCVRVTGCKGRWHTGSLRFICATESGVSCAVEVWIVSYKEYHGLASFLNWCHQPSSLVCIATPWRNPGSDKPDMMFDGDIPAPGGTRWSL